MKSSSFVPFQWRSLVLLPKSFLKFGEFVLESATGVHQGDPLAGLLFCLVLMSVVDAIEEEVPTLTLNAWYLDDGHIIGTKVELAQVVDIIVREGEPRGLTLSRAATVLPPSSPKSVVWSSMDGLGEVDQDPLQRGIPKVRAGEGIAEAEKPKIFRVATFYEQKLSGRSA